MRKIWTGILIGILILLGITVFVQRKKIFNLSEDDEYDDECECGENCDCSNKEESPEKQVENTIA